MVNHPQQHHKWISMLGIKDPQMVGYCWNKKHRLTKTWLQCPFKTTRSFSLNCWTMLKTLDSIRIRNGTSKWSQNVKQQWFSADSMPKNAHETWVSWISRCHWAPQLTLNPRKARVFGAPCLCLGVKGISIGEMLRLADSWHFNRPWKKSPFFDRWIPICSPFLLISLISLFWKLVNFTDIRQTLVKMHFMANLGCLPVWFYHSFFFLPLLGWDWTPEHGALSPWFYRWWYSLIYSLFSRFSATVKISHFAHLFELSTASLDTQPDKLISLQCVEPGHCRSSS